MHADNIHFFVSTIFSALSLLIAIGLLKYIKYPRAQNGIQISTLIPVLILGALVGIKIPVLISYGWQAEFLWTGKSYFGAIIGAFLSINIYKYLRNIKGNFGDRFVIPLCVSAGIGKIGCFFYGCCSGTATQFVLSIKNSSGVYVHPVQLYESLFEFACASLFFIFYKSKRFYGSHFLIYILLYMSFRFCIEFIRIEPKILYGFSIYQLMSILFVPFFGLLLYQRLRNVQSHS